MESLMSRTPPKRPRDFNQLAKLVVDQATGAAPRDAETPPTKSERQQAAALLGRLGGLKGGRARAEKLSATKRRAIAKKAARARWARR
jgi:hypothetical protein